MPTQAQQRRSTGTKRRGESARVWLVASPPFLLGVSRRRGWRRGEGRKMSKKNNLAKRKKQYEFDLQREKEAKEKQVKKLQAKKSKMKIDGSDKKKGGQFKVGKKKVKTKLSALTKAKAAQAMEVDK